MRLKLLLVLFATTLLAQSSVESALRSGKNLMLVIWDARTPAGDDETRADWAAYLNDFVKSKPANLKVIKLTPLTYSRLIVLPKVKGKFATVFLRDLNHALIYQGAVVEPQIYTLGSDYVANKDSQAKSRADFGLVETSVRLRKQ